MKTRFFALVVPMLLLSFGGVMAAPVCGAQPVAVLTVTNVQGFLVLPARIDDVPVSMLLDTGAEAGLLRPEAASALALPLDQQRGSVIQGTGGAGALRPNVRVPVLQLGRLRLGGLSLPVGPLPAVPRLRPPVAGLLGADLLAQFDLEFDLAHDRLRLFPAGLCGETPPWPGAVRSPLGFAGSGPRLLVPVTLDNAQLTGLLDTGTRSLVLSERAAALLGVDGTALARDPGGITAGVDLRDVPYHWHHFKKLLIGGQTIAHPVLTVTTVNDDADMLIGTPFFTNHVVWISGTDRFMAVAPTEESNGANAKSAPLKSGPGTTSLGGK